MQKTSRCGKCAAASLSAISAQPYFDRIDGTEYSD
jgi:hypothetical protein